LLLLANLVINFLQDSVLLVLQVELLLVLPLVQDQVSIVIPKEQDQVQLQSVFNVQAFKVVLHNVEPKDSLEKIPHVLLAPQVPFNVVPPQ